MNTGSNCFGLIYFMVLKDHSQNLKVQPVQLQRDKMIQTFPSSLSLSFIYKYTPAFYNENVERGRDNVFLKKMGQPQHLFCFFLFFSNTKFSVKTVDFSGIRTRIVGLEGEHAGHLTTTTARERECLACLEII